MRFLGIIFLLLFSGYAEAARVKVHPKDLHLYVPTEKLPSIINGRDAAPGENENTFMMGGCEGGSCYSCTATLYGPKILVTAAHCVGERMSFPYLGAQVSFTCEVEPNKVDGALCVTDQEINLKWAHFPPAKAVKIGTVTWEYGYGATDGSNGGNGGNDGILRVGENIAAFDISGQVYESRNGAGVVIGPGDSGGPSFAKMTDPFSEKNIGLGIHSYVYVDTETQEIDDISGMVDLTDTRMQAFIKDFVARKGLKACGVNDACDGSGTEPPPPADCKAEEKAVKKANTKYQIAKFTLAVCDSIFRRKPEKCAKLREKELNALEALNAAEAALEVCRGASLGDDGPA